MEQHKFGLVDIRDIFDPQLIHEKYLLILVTQFSSGRSGGLLEPDKSLSVPKFL